MSRLDFLYRMDLPHRAVSVYIYLSDRADKNGECWPAIPTIASDLKLPSQPSAVRYTICVKQDLYQRSNATVKKAARAVCFTKYK